MFKTIIFVLISIEFVLANLDEFPDKDAFFLAQRHNGSLLEPPKQDYEKIHGELEAIKKAYPVVSHIRMIPDLEPGKLICNKEIDLEKLNASVYGPVCVEQIGADQFLITFAKPYNEMDLGRLVIDKFGYNHPNSTTSCSSVRLVGGRTQIIRSDMGELFGKEGEILYFFTEKSGDCFVFCRVQHTWLFKIKDGKVVLDKEYTDDLDKRTTPVIPRTTPKF